MISYFYILTTQWSRNGQPNYGTMSGIWEAPEGTSEIAIYRELFAESCSRYNSPTEFTGVMFYRIARNEL